MVRLRPSLYRRQGYFMKLTEKYLHATKYVRSDWNQHECCDPAWRFKGICWTIWMSSKHISAFCVLTFCRLLQGLLYFIKNDISIYLTLQWEYRWGVKHGRIIEEYNRAYVKYEVIYIYKVMCATHLSPVDVALYTPSEFRRQTTVEWLYGWGQQSGVDFLWISGALERRTAESAGKVWVTKWQCIFITLL